MLEEFNEKKETKNLQNLFFEEIFGMLSGLKMDCRPLCLHLLLTDLRFSQQGQLRCDDHDCDEEDDGDDNTALLQRLILMMRMIPMTINRIGLKRR